MKGRNSDELRIGHILEAIKEIENYTTGMTVGDFKINSMARFATIKQLEIIGEAANHLSQETTGIYPQIAWEEISGLRNILVHEYFGIDTDLIWQIVQYDIPSLKKALSPS